MRAELVLEDCRKALELLEETRDEQTFRVLWVALIALLRAVGHVLQKVDGAEDEALGRVVASRWKVWLSEREKHRLFWNFIEAERNSVLKMYEIGVQPGDVRTAVIHSESARLFTLDECIFKPLLDGPFAGEDGRDVAREAIDWWKEQLSMIKSDTI